MRRDVSPRFLRRRSDRVLPLSHVPRMRWLWPSKPLDFGTQADILTMEATAVFRDAHDKITESVQLYHQHEQALKDRLAELADEADNVGLDLKATSGTRLMVEKQLGAIKEIIGAS